MRILLLLLASVTTLAADAARDARWTQDLDTLTTQLPRLHPNLFFHVSRADFNQAAADLRAAIPSLSDVEVMAGMARITAMPGDGHTNLFLTQRNSMFRLLPLQLKWFQDGLFVVAVGQAYPRAAGARVIQIGTVPLDDAYQAVSAIISHENDSWVRDQSPNYLVNADLLQALKIAPSNSSVTFQLEDAASQFTVDIASLDPNTSTRNTIIPDPNTGFTPLYRQHNDRYYWYTYFESSRTFYFAYNVCEDQSDLPFAQFNAQLWQAFDASHAELFVIDLRNNSGGNSAVINPFLISGAARANLISSVRAAVIIGQHTFSSGILDAIQLKQGPVIFVGEPSGGSPNSYGEVQTLVLPNSQLNVSYSTRYFNTGYPDGPLMPDVAVPIYSADYFARHDPFLAAVLADAAPSSTFNSRAVFNSATLRPDAPVAPGSLATLFADLGSAVSADAASIPLPAKLGGMEVLVDGVAAPLLAVRPGQVNFQVPSATSSTIATVHVRRDGGTVGSYSAWIAGTAPGLYAGAVLDQNGGLVTADRSAAPGSVIQIYANGQGATDPPVADGAAPGGIAQSRLVPRVYFGADLADVVFSGLSPAFPGLWQINVRVPESPNVSGQMPVFVAIGATASNGVSVPVGN